MVKTATALAILLATSTQVVADCRQALLLGLDISSSVDMAEDQLQRGGMVSALLSDRVTAAFLASPTPVALAVFEWSGRYNQEVLLNWRMIQSREDLLTAAEIIASTNRSYNEFPTAMGLALEFAAEMLSNGPKCWQQTIDIAGDGENNEGPGPAVIYQNPAFDQITVNGLVVAGAADFQTEERLIGFYTSEVLHGAGSFMVVADGFDDYARAMEDKLVRELSVAVIGAHSDLREPKG